MRIRKNLAETFLLLSFLVGLFCLFLSQVIWTTEIGLKFYRLINFHIIHEHSFREAIYFLQLPAYLALRLSTNIELLKTLYALPCFLIPILSLSLSWWAVGKKNSFLFIWPVLSILLGHLYSQHQIDSEHNMVAQLTWPYLLGILKFSSSHSSQNQRRKLLAWISGFSLLLFFLHPISFLSFILAAILLHFQQVKIVTTQSKKVICLSLLIFSLLRILCIYLHFYDQMVVNRYLTWGSTHHLGKSLWYFSLNNAFLPLINLLTLWGLGLFFILPKKKTWTEFSWQLLGLILIALHLLSYLLPLLFSEKGIESWVLHFRISLFLSMPFFIFFLFEVVKTKTKKLRLIEKRRRTDFLPWIGLCYLISLEVLSLKWHYLDIQTSKEISVNTTFNCIPVEDLNSLPNAFKQYFAIPIYFLLKQGQKPQHLLWFKADCYDFYRYQFLGFIDTYRGLQPWQATPPDLYFDYSDMITRSLIHNPLIGGKKTN